jgi:RNA polymerase sigma factor (sigma-70 family)
LEDVVRELNPLLWRVARSQGLGAEEATDVVQTAWLELLRRLNDIHSPQALTAWLVTTTRRESWRVRERGRRDRHEESDVMEALPDTGIGPAEQILVDERDASLWRNLEQLPLRCRQLLTVVAQVGRPDYGAIAEALGMPHGSIGPTRGRCLAKLRQLLLADPTWSA